VNDLVNRLCGIANEERHNQHVNGISFVCDQAADRIAALEAENNELQAWVDGYREHGTRVLNANKEEIDTLEAKLDELQTAINTACNTIKRQPLDRVPSCLMELWDE